MKKQTIKAKRVLKLTKMVRKNTITASIKGRAELAPINYENYTSYGEDPDDDMQDYHGVFNENYIKSDRKESLVSALRNVIFDSENYITKSENEDINKLYNLAISVVSSRDDMSAHRIDMYEHVDSQAVKAAEVVLNSKVNSGRFFNIKLFLNSIRDVYMRSGKSGAFNMLLEAERRIKESGYYFPLKMQIAAQEVANFTIRYLSLRHHHDESSKYLYYLRNSVRKLKKLHLEVENMDKTSVRSITILLKAGEFKAAYLLMKNSIDYSNTEEPEPGPSVDSDPFLAEIERFEDMLEI